MPFSPKTTPLFLIPTRDQSNPIIKSVHTVIW